MSKQDQPPPPDDAPPDPPRHNGPAFILGVLDKTNNAHGTVGVGWHRKDGAIRITLNPGVVLSYADLQDSVITLFPKDK